MPAITTRTFAQIVDAGAAKIRESAAALVDMSVGSILRALLESNAALILWIQGMVLQVLTLTRASTSAGGDLDTWMQDFGLTRLPAVPAAGIAKFWPTSASGQTLRVPVGTAVASVDGSQSYTVYADTPDPAYDAGTSSYLAVSGAAFVRAPVRAVVPGVAGNIKAGALGLIQSPLPGLDRVINEGDFTAGEDVESDVAFRARFVDHINSLSKATRRAVASAIQSVQSGLSWTIVEGLTYAGTSRPASFYVVLDDGSGEPSDALISNAAAAIEAVRPLGVVCTGVFPPAILYVDVAATLDIRDGYDSATAISDATAAVQSYFGGLGIGDGLPATRVAQLAYDSNPGIRNVSSIMLNGSTSDLVISMQQTIKPQTITFAAEA